MRSDITLPRHKYSQIRSEYFGWQFTAHLRNYWATPPIQLGLLRRNSETCQKDPANGLRAFPAIPIESTAGIPQALQFKAFEGSRAFPEFSPPSTAGDISFFRKGSGEGLSELVMEFPAVVGVFLNY